MLADFISLYESTLIALYILLLMVFVQALVATVAHRMQKQYVPGIVNENLGHESFVVRSHRTFMNSLENVPFMCLLVLLAAMVGIAPQTLAIITWVYVLARLLHMVLYYKIATEKNPSPRSHFYLIGVLAQLTLFVLLAIHFLS